MAFLPLIFNICRSCFVASSLGFEANLELALTPPAQLPHGRGFCLLHNRARLSVLRRHRPCKRGPSVGRRSVLRARVRTFVAAPSNPEQHHPGIPSSMSPGSASITLSWPQLPSASESPFSGLLCYVLDCLLFTVVLVSCLPPASQKKCKIFCGKFGQFKYSL